MDYNCIIVTEHKGWVEITLNRPKVYNALNKDLLEELLEVITEAERDNKLRCIVITGQGGVFCSGQDLKSVGEDLENIPFAKIVREQYNPLILKIRQCSKTIICKLNGLAAGAGCSLALACDLIVASKDAYLAEIFPHIGLVMDGGSTYFLLNKLGYTKAYEIATTGRKVYADEAEKIGLITKSVDSSGLNEVVQQYIDVYTNASSTAVGGIKEMLHKAAGMSLDEVLEMEAEFQQKVGGGKDFIEGIRAFLEKRKPNFNQ
ncbi:enoyl-CoA hydratase/isomerase family protein [Echinicola salinicaeni]|uniref:enoyl-CoA hydratase/isomerase family protein n=1 Tax=Echinicola salinicaeni TaxID=2762757 RepID=UPI001648AD5D|nr:enoyl-CoA hydratase/isomerase family protein [Echinicola salinicaeni]